MDGEQPLVSAGVIIFTLYQNLTNTCYVCEHTVFLQFTKKLHLILIFHFFFPKKNSQGTHPASLERERATQPRSQGSLFCFEKGPQAQLHNSRNMAENYFRNFRKKSEKFFWKCLKFSKNSLKFLEILKKKNVFLSQQIAHIPHKNLQYLPYLLTFVVCGSIHSLKHIVVLMLFQVIAGCQRLFQGKKKKEALLEEQLGQPNTK